MITINGKEYNFKFNYYAIEQFGSVKAAAGSHVGETLKLMWGGYAGYCLDKGIEPEITLSEIIDWLDENLDNETSLKQITTIKESWVSSNAFQRLLKKGLKAQAEKEEEKKSLSNGTTSTHSFGEQSASSHANITVLHPTKDGALQLATITE